MSAVFDETQLPSLEGSEDFQCKTGLCEIRESMKQAKGIEHVKSIFRKTSLYHRFLLIEADGKTKDTSDWVENESDRSTPSKISDTMQKYAGFLAVNREEVAAFSAVTQTLAEKWAKMSMAGSSAAEKGEAKKSAAEDVLRGADAN